MGGHDKEEWKRVGVSEGKGAGVRDDEVRRAWKGEGES